MRVAIEATLASGAVTGLGRYVRELIAGLVRIAPENEYLLFHATETWGGPDFGPSCRPISYGGGKQSIAILFRLNQVLRQNRVDLFHATCNTGVPPRVCVPTVATVHDIVALTHPHWSPFRYRIWFRILFSITRRYATRIVTDSLFTADQLIRFSSIDPERITTIPLAPFRGSTIERQKPKHILCVGAIEPRKGQLRLADAYRRVLTVNPQALPLVFVGPDRGDGTELQRGIDGVDGISWLNYVPHEELESLYAEAAAVVVPSYYEGFGLPVLEAMNHGIPCICSDIAAFRELGGDAVHYLPSEDMDSWRDFMLEIIDDPALLASHRSVAMTHVSRYSWDRCAKETLAVYGELVKTIDEPREK